VNTVEEASTIRDIEHAHVAPAGRVLANAFRGYPFFEYCLGDANNYDRMAPGMFASFVRWTMLYGKSVGDKRSERSCATTAAGNQKHRILECLAFRPSVFLLKDGRCREAAI
jgi:hypothetical protein